MRNSPRRGNNSMTSERKIAANRKNARKSTGPRSNAGRAASRHNARRHGLATGIGSDPALRDDIEILAKLLAGGRKNIGNSLAKPQRHTLTWRGFVESAPGYTRGCGFLVLLPPKT